MWKIDYIENDLPNVDDFVDTLNFVKENLAKDLLLDENSKANYRDDLKIY